MDRPPRKYSSSHTRADAGAADDTAGLADPASRTGPAHYNRKPLSSRSPHLADPASRTGPAHRTRSPKKRGPNLLLIFGILLIVAALAIAAFLAWRYISADLQYKEYADLAGIDMSDMPADVDPSAIEINWDALHEINPDIVGWILIPDTRINYPIVQTTDNSFYLNHLFDRSYDVNGSIFLDYESSPDLLGKNNMIYGHNMLNGSMFAGLKDYRSADFYSAHKRVLILTPEHNLELEVVSILTCEADDKIRQVHFGSEEDYAAYVNMLLAYADSSDIDPNNIPNNIYCFATCTELGNTKRFLVMAKPVMMDGQVVSDAPAVEPTAGADTGTDVDAGAGAPADAATTQ